MERAGKERSGDIPVPGLDRQKARHYRIYCNLGISRESILPNLLISSEKHTLFLTKKRFAMKKHADSIDAAILDRIRSGPQDRVWTPQDFIDLGSRAAVDKALSRNCQNGSIRRAGRGLYHLPRNHPALGPLGPSYDAMQNLIQRKADGDVFPTGAHAANVLGLSDQVPMRSWHLTTGPSRRIRSGNSEIVLRHVSPRFVSTKNPKSAQVILALRWLGRRAVDDDVISTLRRNLSPSDRAGLLADAGCAPAWIADIFHHLAKDSTAA